MAHIVAHLFMFILCILEETEAVFLFLFEMLRIDKMSLITTHFLD